MLQQNVFGDAATLYIIGASGLAREMQQLARTVAPSSVAEILMCGIDDEDEIPDGSLGILGIGYPTARATAFERLHSRMAFATLVHPKADIGDSTSVMEGSIVTSGVVSTTDIYIGRGVLLNLNCTVGHDARVEDFCVVNPGAAISGGVTIEREVLVGTGACILEGRRIGRGAKIGAGAVVTKDVPPGAVVTGVPARPMAQGTQS